MDKNKLLDKNQKLIDMVIERVKRDFKDDIAIIGLTGSFATGDFNEKSDLDLIIINNTRRGFEISYCFILDDVGYDIYCTPWEPRIKNQSELNSPMVSCLTDLKILYCAKPEYKIKFNEYRQKALEKLAEPIGKDCIERAKKHIDSAKIEYTNAMISDEIGEVRYYSASILYDIVNAIVSLNNTCIKFGVKRYLEELSKYEYLPENFEKNYMAVIDSKIVEELRENSLVLLKNLEHLYNKMYTQFIDKPKPTATNLKGTYEELWCNCRNKIITSIDLNDKNYAFQAALSAQHYLNEIAKNIGTPKFDLLKHFDSDNLQVFKNVFLQAMDSYLSEYNKASLKVEKFNTFEELYENFIIRTKNND